MNRYYFFSQFNGALLGGCQSNEELNLVKLGITNAIVVLNNIEFSACKYDFNTNQIVEIAIEEADELIKEASTSIRDLKLAELEKKYNQAQNLIINDGDKQFTLPLRNSAGYNLFKDKLNIALAQGSAIIYWIDNNTNTLIQNTYSKEVFINVSVAAEGISMSNFILQDSLKNAINNAPEEEVASIEINFPAIQSVDINS